MGTVKAPSEKEDNPWKIRIMLLFAVLLLGVGIHAAPQQHYPKSSYHQPKSSYQPKCSYQPKEECTTVYENIERQVRNVECHTEYGRKCHTEYKQKCTRGRYGKKSCKRVPREVCEINRMRFATMSRGRRQR